MVNKKYDPSLSQAGFMDLVCALQTHLKTTDALKLLAAMPNAHREAVMQLGDAATNYINVVQASNPRKMKPLNACYESKKGMSAKQMKALTSSGFLAANTSPAS